MKLLPLLAMLLGLSFCASSQTISLLKEIRPTTSYVGSVQTEYKKAGSWLYFVAGKDLWKTDGSTANTTLVISFPVSGIYGLTSFNNKLYFLGDDSIHGLELWSTSGSAVTTSLVKDINPGAGSGFSKAIISRNQIKVMGGNMYFLANDGVNGVELTKSDGTATGTQMVLDINPAAGASGVDTNDFAGLEVFDNHVYFSGYPDASTVNRGLWRSTGTAAGTQVFVNCGRSTNLFVCSNKLYFSSDNLGICTTDGLGVYILDSTINRNYFPPVRIEYTVLNSTLFFTGSDDYIHATDGTAATTRKIASCKSPSTWFGQANGRYDYKKTFLTTCNNKIYYADSNSLWSADGTIAGTTKITPTSSTEQIYSPMHLVAMNGNLYFKSLDSNRVDIWVSDGTNAGTHSVKMPGANFMTKQLAFRISGACIGANIFPYDNQLIYLNSYDSSLKAQLYKLDTRSNSVENSTLDNEITVYPNPASNEVSARFEHAGFEHITIYDQAGRQVKMLVIGKDEQVVRFRVDDLANGIYYVEVRGKGKVAAHKFLVQR